MILLIKKTVLSFIITLLFAGGLNAQNLPAIFQNTLEQMDIILSFPLENSYKRGKIKRSEFFQADYILRSRKKKVEIQYRLIPDKEEKIIPPIQASTIVSTLCRNEEASSTITIHQLKEEALLENYYADWGTIAFFQPKRSFTNYKHGKLISLYKKGKGMVYVLFLFNESAAEEVDYFPVRFENQRDY